MATFKILVREYIDSEPIELDQYKGEPLSHYSKAYCYIVEGRIPDSRQPIMNLDWIAVGDFNFGSVSNLHNQVAVYDRLGFYNCEGKSFDAAKVYPNQPNFTTNREIPRPKVKDGTEIEFFADKWHKYTKAGKWIAA